jgi:hypothetical protein
MKRTLMGLALATLLAVTACSSGDSTAGDDTAPPSASASLAASPEASMPEGDVTIGGDLPDSWPAEVPAYADGTLLTAVVLDDGGTLNASWGTDQDADAAWSTLDTDLRARGFLPVGDLGEESLFVSDDTQITDTYRSDAFEVNVVVARGDQATVFINASRLG